MTIRIIEKILDIPLQNEHGVFFSGAYRTESNGRQAEHLLLYQKLATQPLMLRINSACYTGDIFGCRRCDCHWQLQYAMQYVAAAGNGLILYHMHHEGRANGLIEKLRSHGAADHHGLKGGAAYTHLGYPADSRTYNSSLVILRDLGVASVRLITNNPEKREILERGGIHVANVIRVVSPDPALGDFYRWKREDFGHDV